MQGYSVVQGVLSQRDVERCTRVDYAERRKKGTAADAADAAATHARSC